MVTGAGGPLIRAPPVLCSRRNREVRSLRKLIIRLGLESRLRAENLSRYVMQCALATAAVLTLLLILDAFTQTVLIAALGASTFIAFAVPRSLHSDPRHMIGGYIVGICAGGLMGMLNDAVAFTSPAADHALVIALGALATGLAMFLMVITKTEHPPAAALALGLVLNEWDWQTLAFIVGGIVVLTIVKQLVMPLLMDLL
jgi:CBS-domain-containing membrane protein